MYEITKEVIQSGRFELSAMLKKIDTLWLQDSITDDQKTELETLAQNKATPENSYAGIQQRIDGLYFAIQGLTEVVKALTDRITVLEGGEVPEPPKPEEWPEYVQPQGAHDAYKTGDKITYNGKHYICKMDGCVWPPTEYPQGWELVEETPKEEPEQTEQR